MNFDYLITNKEKILLACFCKRSVRKNKNKKEQYIKIQDNIIEIKKLNDVVRSILLVL